MKTRFSKLVATVLCASMVISMLPVTAFAASADFTQSELTVATEKHSTLAPGVTQDAYTVYDKNGDQVEMFITTADMSVDSVKVFASYKDMDPTNYGMSKLTEQVAAFNKKAEAGDAYYQGTVVAGINSSYYNMITGKPTGTFVMNGIDVTTESEGNAYGYFAVMKDGSVKIGNKGDYSKDKGNIQEAIGIYTMLIVDGEICSGLNTTQKYPRQTIGITADGDVILMTADGNQAPKSIGLTVLEQAQVMKDLGCVWAGHLDGGGSCTYAAKAEGSDEFKIANSPSDGSERSVSNGFIIVSTAVSDGKFHSASLAAENEYVTPNSVVSIAATGVDKAGGPADIPVDDIQWQMADPSFGTVSNGVFTSTGKEGDAVVQMTLDGKVVGETTVHVVLPDKVSFSTPEMTVPYGKSVSLELVATYGAKNVAVKPSDFSFDLSAPIGTIKGFEFAANESADKNTATLTAELLFDKTITASTNITLGKGSEVVYDFEDGTNQKVYIDETPGTKYNYVWPETEQNVVTARTGKVHSGTYALGASVNYGNSLESGYMKTSVYATETRVFENAVGIGAWLYIPDEWVGLWARWTLRTVTGFNADGTPIWGSSLNSNTMDATAGGTGVVYTFDEPGWHYLYADTSAYPAVGWSANGAMMQFYISDRDGAAYQYKAAENSNIPGKFMVYLDDITVDYSTAVDDRYAPQFSGVTYATEGMPDAAALNGNTITTNKVTIAASVADNPAGANVTGLDAFTVEAYIDGVEVDCTYANGKVSINDAELTNGKHTIKFGACDKQGNYGYIYQYITVDAPESASTVKLVPQNADLDRIKLSSVYYLDLKATAIEEVESVSVEIDLDNNSTWELDYMTPAAGFTASYDVDEAENIAEITITRTGENDQTGEETLVSLPVRVWTLKTGYTYPNGTKQGAQALTLAQFKAQKEFWRMSVIATVDRGVLNRVDGTTDTFTGERVFCDTEMWGNFAKMDATADGKAYYNAWDGGHVHTAKAIADKAPTCSETGYSDRTFCQGCNSVVDWGYIEEATGHIYETVEGVRKCACGELFTGEHNGQAYVDGVVVTDGWVGDSFYRDGVKLTGLQQIGEYYYDFGDDGVCPNRARLNGFYYDEAADKYRHFTAGIMSVGDVNLFPVVYFFDEDGYAVSGEVTLCDSYVCIFDEQGAFEDAEDSAVVDAGFCGTNIEYVLLSDGTLKVGGQGVMRDYTVNGIYPPWIIKNDMEDIRAIEIGNDVTKLGKFAFYRNGHVKTVSFEENSSLETIGWGAFGHCWRLGQVTIPASVETLEEYAFYECGDLKSFDVEEGSQLTTIKAYAFQNDTSLERVYFPDGVTNIGDAVLHKTVKVSGGYTAVALPNVVAQVVEYSVAHAYAVKNGIAVELREGTVLPAQSGQVSQSIDWELYLDGTLKLIGSGAMPNYTGYTQQPWGDYRHQINKIIIDKDITSVGNYAFAYAQNVTEVEFEEGSELESIGVLSFFNNPKVSQIILPETVTSISAYAFGDCFALEDVYVPQGTGFIYGNAFSNDTNVVLNVAKGTYAEAFAQANGVAYEIRDFVYIPIDSGDCGEDATWALYDNGELWIEGSGAMDNFTSHNQQPWGNSRHLIKKIIIGADITSVGNYAFAYAQNVTEVEFEEGSELESIGVLSFFNNPKVSEIVLPESVASISAYAFGDCFALVDFYVPQGTGFIYSTAFTNSDDVVLSVAEGTYAEAFAQANGVAYEVRDFVYIPVESGYCGEDVTWALYDNGELWIEGSGTMDNFTSHNQQPWGNSRHMIKKIIIGADITSVGNYAFAYAQNVTEVEFEDGSELESIGVLSFFNNPKVSEIVLPESVASISAYAFGDCFALVDFYVPQGTGFIYNTAFTNSDDVVLSVAEGTYAEVFAQTNGVDYEVREFVYSPVESGDCGEEATWALYDNGELWIEGSGAMENFTNHSQQPWGNSRHLIKKIVIGADITSVGNYAFAYAQNVTEVEFEDGSELESIGVLSFFNNPKVSEIILPETVASVMARAFGECAGLESVYIPAGTVTIDANAFAGSSDVVLYVEEGSYAEQFAVNFGIDYEIW